MDRRGHSAMTPGAPNSIFRAALLCSTLLHLSMVTVFSIVIYFPVRQVQFFDFSIVEAPPIAPVAPAAGSAPGNLTLSGGPGLRLPDIELPQLEFAELNRLRIRQEGLEESDLYERLFPSAPRDSWQRLTQSLRNARLSLSRSIGMGGPPEQDPLAPAQPVHRPAQGFEAYIEWTAGAPDRLLLFAPPIEALWDLDPHVLQRPMEIVMEVNPQGRVVNVWSPSSEPAGIVDSVQLAVLKYRFEPLLGDDAPTKPEEGAGDLKLPMAFSRNATAILHIQAERGRHD